MSKNLFCGNCGNRISNNDTFCGECGEKNTAFEPNEIGSSPTIDTIVTTDNVNGLASDKKTNNINTMIGIAVISVLVLVVGYFVINIAFFQGNPEYVAKQYIKAYLTYDGDDIVELAHPKVIEAYLTDNKIKLDALEDSIEDSTKYYVDRVAASIDVGTRNLSKYVTYEIYDRNSPTEREFDAILDRYEKYLDINIKDATIIDFDLYFESSQKDIHAEYEVSLIKVGLYWYFDILEHNYKMSY